jgi:hypothetical protein
MLVISALSRQGQHENAFEVIWHHLVPVLYSETLSQQEERKGKETIEFRIHILICSSLSVLFKLIIVFVPISY